MLLSTGPYSASSGTSASCCAYADWVSAAVGGGGVTDILLEAGTPMVSSVLGPKIWCQAKAEYKGVDATHGQLLAQPGPCLS